MPVGCRASRKSISAVSQLWSPLPRCELRQWGSVFVLAICVVLFPPVLSRTPDLAVAQSPLRGSQKAQLPLLQAHPLPPSLAQWHDPNNRGDYFSQVASTDVGYLIWTRFPVKVYLEQPTSIPLKARQVWADAVLQAIQEWNAYLPLQVVSIPDSADITIRRSEPNQQTKGRIRSAETRYELYVNQLGILSHRFTILIRPRGVPEYILAAVRHELGHALGIWGHSPLETDALYFSQVRNPPRISARDINTLKQVYRQPTRLGWPSDSSSLLTHWSLSVMQLFMPSRH